MSLNWPERLRPGMPPLRPGEFAMLTGWSYDSIRKQMIAGAIPGNALVEGGEKRIPVPFARETAVKLGVLPTETVASFA